MARVRTGANVLQGIESTKVGKNKLWAHHVAKLTAILCPYSFPKVRGKQRVLNRDTSNRAQSIALRNRCLDHLCDRGAPPEYRQHQNFAWPQPRASLRPYNFAQAKPLIEYHFGFGTLVLQKLKLLFYSIKAIDFLLLNCTTQSKLYTFCITQSAFSRAQAQGLRSSGSVRPPSRGLSEGIWRNTIQGKCYPRCSSSGC